MQLLPPIQATESRQETLTVSDGAIVAELQQNTLYTISSTDFTSLTLTIANDFEYCTLDFTTGNTAPTFAISAGFYFSGASCSDGVFLPVGDTRYSVALTVAGLTKLAYVWEVV